MRRHTRHILPLVRLTVLTVMLAMGGGLLGALHRGVDHHPGRHVAHTAASATQVHADACGLRLPAGVATPPASPVPAQDANPAPASDTRDCATCHMLASWSADRLGLAAVSLPTFELVFSMLSSAPLTCSAVDFQAARFLRGPPTV